jgi:hypothetical protein
LFSPSPHLVDLMVHEKQRQEILKDLGADPYVD